LSRSSGIVVRMTSSATIHYAGSFRFPDRSLLEAALVRARAKIDEEADLAALKGGWMRCFVMTDATLTVNIILPAQPKHRIAAAEIFDVLSRDAVDGTVTATIDEAPVEMYSVERWA
jgi:hypothetical protein